MADVYSTPRPGQQVTARLNGDNGLTVPADLPRAFQIIVWWRTELNTIVPIQVCVLPRHSHLSEQWLGDWADPKRKRANAWSEARRRNWPPFYDSVVSEQTQAWSHSFGHCCRLKYMFAKLTFTHSHILEKLKSKCDEHKGKRQSQYSQYEQHMNSFNSTSHWWQCVWAIRSVNPAPFLAVDEWHCHCRPITLTTG